MFNLFFGFLMGVVLSTLVVFLSSNKEEKEEERSKSISLYIPDKIGWKKTHKAFNNYRTRLKTGVGDLILNLRGYDYEKFSKNPIDNSEYNIKEKVWVWTLKTGKETLKKKRLDVENSPLILEEAKKEAFKDVIQTITD